MVQEQQAHFFSSLAEQSRLICGSYEAITGTRLVEVGKTEIAEALFYADFVLLSHGAQPDPILNYGNQNALELWEMDWSEFCIMPSQYTAEAKTRKVRAETLYTANQNAYVSGYSGVRISSTGIRFLIKNAEIWVIRNEAGVYCGQAAKFDEWEYVKDAGA